MDFWVEANNTISYTDLIKIINNNKKVPKEASENLIFYIELINEIIKNREIQNFNELIDILFFQSDEFSFKLQTSGTTSKPKEINIDLKKCIRQVKKVNQDNKNIWGLCYPHNSFASTQVFFQSLFNKETIVNLYDENLEFNEISKKIINNNVNRLTCTPTFLKMLCISSEKKFKKIKSVTVGGEILDETTINYFNRNFENAKLINIYASTEGGSLMYSNSNYFEIPEKYKDRIKIKNNELILHNILVNKGSKNKDEWFKTGDMIEFKENQQLFKFVGRKNSYVNIGGNRVNVFEVEQKICELDYILDAKVFTKKNNILGTILTAEVISLAENSKKIKNDLKKALPNYKIPLKFYFKQSFELTKSGKKTRK